MECVVFIMFCTFKCCLAVVMLLMTVQWNSCWRSGQLMDAMTISLSMSGMLVHFGRYIKLDFPTLLSLLV